MFNKHQLINERDHDGVHGAQKKRDENKSSSAHNLPL
jgi:hypothetical protein